MPVGRLILLGLLGLVVAEAAVFLMVAQLLGSFTALFLLFATSILGGAGAGRGWASGWPGGSLTCCRGAIWR